MPMTCNRASCWWNPLLRTAVFYSALLTSVLIAADDQSYAADAPLRLRTVWGMPNDGIVRFCYRPDESPAVIYFRYYPDDKRTAIVKRYVNTDEQVLAEFPGRGNERSLSCSDDGETIAAFDNDEKVLLIRRGADTALYKLSQWRSFSNRGLLSPDGGTIALPVTDSKGGAIPAPELISGRDLLKDFRVFKHPWANGPYLLRDRIYTDVSTKIDDFGRFRTKIVRYGFVENEWRPQEEFGAPQNYGPYSIATCGSHDIAALSNDESMRFVVLDKAGSAKPDWLEKIGFRKILRRYRDPQHIRGRYSQCAFALYRRAARPWVAEGILRFDDQGMKSFLFFPQPVALGDDEVFVSRDGCYALIQMFDQIPDIPQFTLPQQARLLQVETPQCQ